MQMKSLILTLTAIAAVAGTATAGDVTGKITLKGTPAPEKEIPMDPACGALHAGKKPTTRFYVADASGGLADCVVYLEGAKGAAGTAPVVIDQKGCEYLPYINTASVNQTIRVLNSDPVMHNIHPTPTVDGNKESNKAQLPKGAPLDHSFPKAEKFLRFKCDVHPWMFAYVSVFEHGFHAVSGKDGTFKITGVPDGKYKLVVEHRKGGKVEKDIEVKGGAKADFTIEAK
jgi:plastocyanin